MLLKALKSYILGYSKGMTENERPTTRCAGTSRPTNVRSCAGTGSKGFGKRLGVCACGETKFVKNGRVYAHNTEVSA